MATLGAHGPARLLCIKRITSCPPNARRPTSHLRPGRRRWHIASMPVSAMLSVLLLLCLCAPAFAAHRPGFHERRPKVEGRENDIIFDPRQPPLERRQFNLEPSSSKERRATKTSSRSAPSSTAEAEATETPESTTTNGIASAPMPSGFMLPKAFDGGLGTNFTQPSCPTFLKEMIRNETFISCLPFSVLLQVGPRLSENREPYVC